MSQDAQVSYVDLATLDPDHPLRNTPLRDIRAECRNTQSQVWRDLQTWYIARFTYNQLGESWTTFTSFRAR